jgi:hypothetical protein
MTCSIELAKEGLRNVNKSIAFKSWQTRIIILNANSLFYLMYDYCNPEIEWLIYKIWKVENGITVFVKCRNAEDASFQCYIFRS